MSISPDKIDSAAIAELETSLPFDALVVLGKNIGIGWKADDIALERNTYHLSHHSMMNVFAAAYLYEPGMKVIFTSGQTSGPTVISEAEGMRQLFFDFSHVLEKRIRQSDIVLEQESFDTATNAQYTKPIVDDLGKTLGHPPRIGLISSPFHIENAQYLFEQYEIPTTAINAYDVVREHAPSLVTELEERDADFIEMEYGRESIRGLLLHTIDSKGSLLRWLTRRRTR